MSWSDESDENLGSDWDLDDEDPILAPDAVHCPSSESWSDDSDENIGSDWDIDNEEPILAPDAVHCPSSESWRDESDENLGSDWDIDDEEPILAPADAVHCPSSEACEAGTSHADCTSQFIAMGFSEELVAQAIKRNSEEDAEGILETLLINGTDDVPEKEKAISTLVQMGFLAEEASSAFDRCPDAAISDLVDSICAARMAGDSDDDDDDGGLSDYEHEDMCGSPTSSSSASDSDSDDESYEYNPPKRKKIVSELERNKRTRICERKKKEHMKSEHVTPSAIPRSMVGSPSAISKPMIGFGLPFERPRISHRNLPAAATGQPYFYYENVAQAPKGAWETMSRFLYDIEPEFVDSKHFCATARKRGYIHNLPIDNRSPLLPIPPKTIHEAFPSTRQWWPEWDNRTHLNCLMTSHGSSKLNGKIHAMLARCGDPPPQRVQEYVVKQCRKWNLLWIGPNKVAPLEPEEIEMLLGFPKDHTRGITWTERYISLANSFQLDTVAFHLSVLKGRYPNGITVLSLFSGIGGAELALHRLGIRLKTVVSVEVSESNRNVLRRWWEDTRQGGKLIEVCDVRRLDGDMLEGVIGVHGGFDLVIGGSPCNNLAGRNRYSRDGLEGKHSVLFYDYFRVLDLVKCIMGTS